MPKPMTNDEHVEYVADMKHIFASDAGINVLRGLSTFCLEGQNPYVIGSFDQTAKNCGKISVMLHIRKVLAEDGLPRQDKAITEKEEV